MLPKCLVSQGVEIAIVTMAEEGVCYATSETSGFVSPVRTNIIDPTGAGDALTAAVLFGLLNQMTIDDAVRLGVAAESLTLAYRGAVVRIFLWRNCMTSLDKLHYLVRNEVAEALSKAHPVVAFEIHCIHAWIAISRKYKTCQGFRSGNSRTRLYSCHDCDLEWENMYRARFSAIGRTGSFKRCSQGELRVIFRQQYKQIRAGEPQLLGHWRLHNLQKSRFLQRVGSEECIVKRHLMFPLTWPN